jgi:hypothetical protein
VARGKVALGFRAHSGWAVMVVVSGSARSIVVLKRLEINLIERDIPKQPYHAAEHLDFKQAAALIRRSEATARKLARAAVRSAVKELHDEGLDLDGAGIVIASGRPQISLAKTLASHALIHTAEGELFRTAIVKACEHFSLPVTAEKDSTLLERANKILGYTPLEITKRTTEAGFDLGPPWTQDEKRATIVAWLALAKR